MTRIITALHEISDRYDALFVDLWGCVHDGVRALPDAVAALQAYRAAGGTVILVTNAPRARDGFAAARRVRRAERCLGQPSPPPATAPARRCSAAWWDGKGLVHRAGLRREFLRAARDHRGPGRGHPRAAGRGRGHRLRRSLRPPCRPRRDASAIPLCQAEGAQAALRQSRYRGGSRRNAGMVRRRAWRSFTPRWGARASISASRTRRSTISRGGG